MDKNKQEILMKNNKLIKTRYSLNYVQNKVFQLILFNSQKENDSLRVAHIPKRQFEEILDTNNHKTVKGITTILQTLRKADIWIIEGHKWKNHGFIAPFEYDEKTEIFSITMFEEVHSLIMSYLNGYTPINLDVFFSFKSFYSQKLYELLRLWSNTKTIINYKVDDLKELLMLENKYPMYRDFKKRIIQPSRKELNEKGLMEVDIKEHKEGRKVVSIDFIVTDKDKRKYFDKESIPDQKQQKSYHKEKKLKFMNFDERQYDYVDLEKKLLGWDEEEEEIIKAIHEEKVD